MRVQQKAIPRYGYFSLSMSLNGGSKTLDLQCGFEFLENELPDDKFRELMFAINLAEVKRENLNPDNPHFAHLSAKKKDLLGAFPATRSITGPKILTTLKTS